MPNYEKKIQNRLIDMLIGMLKIKLNSKTMFTQKLLSENTRSLQKSIPH